MKRLTDLAGISVATTVIALCASLLPAGASLRTDSAALGSQWLTSNVSTSSSLADVVQSALAETEAGGAATSLSGELTYLEQASVITTYVDGNGITPSAANDGPGQLAELIILAHLTGTDTQFGASSLLTRLLNTQQSPSAGTAAGLFGDPVIHSPQYDGTYRQALSLEALALSGYSSSDPAVSNGETWLLAQQCSGITTDGGFTSDRTVGPSKVQCIGQAADFAGPDSNSTAQALTALAMLSAPSGPGTPEHRALGYLSRIEKDSARWGYFTLPADSSSTALVIQALRAAGRSVSSTSTRFARGPLTPLLGLLSFQYTGAGPKQGGFRINTTGLYTTPDPISTEQATQALAFSFVRGG